MAKASNQPSALRDGRGRENLRPDPEICSVVALAARGRILCYTRITHGIAGKLARQQDTRASHRKPEAVMFNFSEFFAGGGMVRAGLGSKWRCRFANDFDPKKC